MSAFKKMRDNGRLPLLIAVAVTVLIVLLFTWWVMTPSWRAIMPAGTSSDVHQEVINVLSQNQIAYREDAQTGEILVQSTDLANVRQQLETAGVQAQSVVGLELFEDIGLGMSEFAQRINYQRGLEGELSETIRSFLDVRSARVHLTIPKESLFKDRQEAAKASVVVEVREGQSLTYDNVTGVQSLISAAVENLSADAVVVLDKTGKVLSTSTEDLPVSSLNPEFDVADAYEQKARELLQGATAGADFKVAVSVKVNYDRVKSIQEKLIPADGQGNGYVVRHTESNLVNPSNIGDDSSTSPGQRTMDEEYLFSRETSEIEYATGRIEQVSVGIVVIDELSEVRINDIRKVITSGLGLNLEQGDRVELVAIPLISEPSTDESSNLEFPAQTYQQVFSNEFPQNNGESFLGLTNIQAMSLVALVGVLLGILLSWLLLRSNKTSKSTISHDERLRLLADAQEWLAKNEIVAKKPGVIDV